MSLDWKMPKEFYETKKHLMYTKEDANGNSKMQVELECLIFTMLHLQHDIDGEMTDEALMEIERRLNLLQGIGCLMAWYYGREDLRDKTYVNIETVIRYWGLWTNVSHLKKTEWNKRFLRMSEPRPYDFKYVLQEAKNKIASCDMTQPERQWAEYEKQQTAKSTAVDTPPAE